MQATLEKGKGYKRILMEEEEEEGLGKQMNMTMKRIMTQDQKGRKIIIIWKNEWVEISNSHGRCRKSMC